jgi:hypothetical protein
VSKEDWWPNKGKWLNKEERWLNTEEKLPNKKRGGSIRGEVAQYGEEVDQ